MGTGMRMKTGYGDEDGYGDGDGDGYGDGNGDANADEVVIETRQYALPRNALRASTLRRR